MTLFGSPRSRLVFFFGGLALLVLLAACKSLKSCIAELKARCVMDLVLRFDAGFEDFDRDGHLDAATADQTDGTVSVFAGTGDGNFSTRDIYRVKSSPKAVVPVDLDGDGDVDFVGTRGNSVPWDGVFWLEQVRTAEPVKSFERARDEDSVEMPLPSESAE